MGVNLYGAWSKGLECGNVTFLQIKLVWVCGTDWPSWHSSIKVAPEGSTLSGWGKRHPCNSLRPQDRIPWRQKREGVLRSRGPNDSPLTSNFGRCMCISQGQLGMGNPSVLGEVPPTTQCGGRQRGCPCFWSHQNNFIRRPQFAHLFPDIHPFTQWVCAEDLSEKLISNTGFCNHNAEQQRWAPAFWDFGVT